MAQGVRKSVTLTTDGSGNATDYIESGYWKVDSVQYTKDDFADGVDITITGEDSGIAIYSGTDVNASVTVRPRGATHSTAGAAATYDGTYPVNDKISIFGERIKVVVGSGGSAKSGTITIGLEF